MKIYANTYKKKLADGNNSYTELEVFHTERKIDIN